MLTSEHLISNRQPKLLLKEIKNRQHKNKTSDTKSKISTSNGDSHNKSNHLSAFEKPYAPNRMSRSQRITNSDASSYLPPTVSKQQRYRQQQQQQQEQQQQQQKQQEQQHQLLRRPVSRSPTPGSMSTGGSLDIGEQLRGKAPVYSVPRSSTLGSFGTFTSGMFDKDQQQASLRSLSRSPTSGSNPSDASSGVNKQQHLEAPFFSVSRSSTLGSIPSLTSGAFDKDQQPASIGSMSVSPIPPSTPATAITVIQSQQHSEAPAHSTSRSSTPGSPASATSGARNKDQKPGINTFCLKISSTSSHLHSNDASIKQ